MLSEFEKNRINTTISALIEKGQLNYANQFLKSSSVILNAPAGNEQGQASMMNLMHQLARL